jgi:hypothetical protein
MIDRRSITGYCSECRNGRKFLDMRPDEPPAVPVKVSLPTFKIECQCGCREGMMDDRFLFCAECRRIAKPLTETGH